MNWHWLTFLGDSMLLLPCAAIIVILLLWKADTRRVCWQWLLLFGGASAVVVASKLAFLGWGIGSEAYDFTGFSGHSAMSASIWPVMLWILTNRASRGAHIAAVAGGYLLAAVVGFSRIILHAHSVSEVMAGLLLGYAISTSFLMMQYFRNTRLNHLSYGQITVVLVLPLVLITQGLQGKKAPTQNLLEQIALEIAPIRHVHTRADLFRDMPDNAPSIAPQ